MFWGVWCRTIQAIAMALVLLSVSLCAAETSQQPTLIRLKQLYDAKNYEQLIQDGHVFLSQSFDESSREVALFFIGDAYFQQGSYGKSVDTLSSLVEAYPHSLLLPQTLLIIGRAYFNQNFYMNAMKNFRVLLHQYSWHGTARDALFWLALSEFRIDHYKQTIVYGLKFLQFDQKNKKLTTLMQKKQVLYHMALSFFYLGKYTQCLKLMDLLLRLSSDEESYNSVSYGKAKALGAMLKYDQALALYDELIQKHKGDLWYERSLWDKIQILLKKEDFSKAREAIATYREEMSRSEEKRPFEISYITGLSYFFEKKYVESLPFFEEALAQAKIIEEKTDVMLFLGRAYYNVQNFKKAAKVFEDIIANDPKRAARAYYNLGWTYMRLNRTVKAVGIFERMVHNHPHDVLIPDILFWLSDYYALKGNKDKQKNYLQQIISQYPETDLVADAYYQLALESRRQDRIEEALSYLDHIDKVNEIYHEALLLKMEIKWRQGSFRDVIAVLTPLVEDASLAVLRQNMFYLLGQSYMGLKMWSKAAETFKQSMYGHEGPIIMESMLGLAYALYHQSMWTEALNMFTTVEMRMSRYTSEDIYYDAKFGAARCFEKLGQYDAATVIYREVIELNRPRYSALARQQYDLLLEKRKVNA